MLPEVTATRFVVPLREGGSLPGIVEADDDGMYVVKFRGAGQGLKVLVAEVVVAGILRRMEVAVPDLVVVDLTSPIARYEADEEVQDLLTASLGRNLGVDYLPGSFGYDGSRPPARELAERVVWVDAFTANVDRTWSNPNLLTWNGALYAIDHGAALYFHHSWPSRAPDASRYVKVRFDAGNHVLAEPAGVGTADASVRFVAVQEHARAVLSREALTEIVDEVPGDWLETTEWLPTTEDVRAAYVDHLSARLADTGAWLPGAAS